MATKLTRRQQAQLEFLTQLGRKFERIHTIIEQMGAMQADEATVRSLCRLLDEQKAQAAALSLGGLADTMGFMATMARRGGGLQMKVRGLRELLGSLKLNHEGAVRAASTPDPDAPEE